MPDFDHVYKAVCGAGRSLGYICDSVLFQLAVAECVDAPIDIEPYDRNRKILYDGLKEIGYDVIYPQGAFYMWIEALEPDAQAFCETCRQHELLLVPSDGFLTKGGRAWATAATRRPSAARSARSGKSTTSTRQRHSVE